MNKALLILENKHKGINLQSKQMETDNMRDHPQSKQMKHEYKHNHLQFEQKTDEENSELVQPREEENEVDASQPGSEAENEALFFSEKNETNGECKQNDQKQSEPLKGEET